MASCESDSLLRTGTGSFPFVPSVLQPQIPFLSEAETLTGSSTTKDGECLLYGCEGRHFPTAYELEQHQREIRDQLPISNQDKDKKIDDLEMMNNALFALLRSLVGCCDLTVFMFHSPILYDGCTSKLSNLHRWLTHQEEQSIQGQAPSTIDLILRSIRRISHSPIRSQRVLDMSSDLYHLLNLCVSDEPVRPPAESSSTTVHTPVFPIFESASAIGNKSTEPLNEEADCCPTGGIESNVTNMGPDENIQASEPETAGSNTLEARPKKKKKHQCLQCWKHFTRSTTLREHTRTHNNDRPFKCRTCGKGFARSKDNKRHEALHVGERNFICKASLHREETGQELFWGCGQRFSREDGLKAHLLTETGWKCTLSLLDEEESWRSFTRLHEDPDLPDEENVFCRRTRTNGDVIGCDFRCRSREVLFEHFRSHEGRRCFRPVLVEVALDDCRLLRWTQRGQKSTEKYSGSEAPVDIGDDGLTAREDHEDAQNSNNSNWALHDTALSSQLGALSDVARLNQGGGLPASIDWRLEGSFPTH